MENIFDILTALLAIITLVLYLRSRPAPLWKGHYIIANGQVRRIVEETSTTITVDKPFDPSVESNDNIFMV